MLLPRDYNTLHCAASSASRPRDRPNSSTQPPATADLEYRPAGAVYKPSRLANMGDQEETWKFVPQ
jgi:hypothetical protein